MNKRAISTMMMAGIIIVVLIVAAIAVYVVLNPPWVQTKTKIGVVLATGGLGDKSYNDISFEGVQRAKEELGIEFDYVQPTDIAQYEGYQRDFARTGEYALIICIAYDQAEPLTKIAAEYPNQSFVLVDMVVDKPNVASLLFKANEGSFLAGVVAAKTTVTGKVGFVGGKNETLIQDFFKGYEAGVKWANSSVTVLPPVYVGGWSDPTTAKELGITLAEQGADVIFPAAGKSGLGALEAVHEKGIIGIGVDSCQCYLHPENIKASVTKRVDIAVYEMIKAVLDKKFEGGVYSKSLKEKWVGLCRLPDEEELWETKFSFTHTTLQTSVINKVIEAKDRIINGTIVVPTAY